MPFTANKNIETPAHGADVNTWDVNANANFTLIDTCFSGTLLLNATGLSGTQVLTQTNVQPPTIQISGAPTAAITYTIPLGIGGVWTVLNSTTGGFAVGIAVAGAGVTVVIPAGQQFMVWTDGGANGLRVSGFPDGTTTPSNFADQTQTANGAVTFLDFTGFPSNANNVELSFNLAISVVGSIVVQYYIAGVLDTAANYFANNAANQNGALSAAAVTAAQFVNMGVYGTAARINGKFWLNDLQDTGRTQCQFLTVGVDSTNTFVLSIWGTGGHYLGAGGPVTGLRIASAANLTGRCSRKLFV